MKKPKVQKQAEFSMYDEQLKMLEAKTMGELMRLAKKHIPFNDMPQGLWDKFEKACNSKEPI